MRARQSARENWLLALSLLMVVGTAALYVLLISGWLSKPAEPALAPAPAAPPAAAPDESALAPARQAFRSDYLDPQSWLALSDALAKAGRPMDAFYVTYGARGFFGDAVFFDALAARQRHGPAAATGDEATLKARLKDEPDDAPAAVALADLYMDAGRGAQAQKVLDAALALKPDDQSLQLAKAQATAPSDPLSAIPLYARAAHVDPSTEDAKRALAALQQYASRSQDGDQADASRLAQQALEELRKAHPKEPAIFSALASALLARGDRATAQALVVEVGRKNRSAAAARIEGLLELSAGDSDAAIASLTEAWDKDPDDLISAEKLASLYAEQRGDPESALPYQIALYRHDPRRLSGVEPLELTIRRALDARRTAVLRNVTVDGLGRYLDSDDASLRAEAAARAGQLKDPRWIDALGRQLDDDAPIAEENAEYALYQIAQQYPSAVKVRRDDWLQGDRPLLRAHVLNLFADLWPNETMPLALKALDDPSPAVRYLAKTLVFDRYYRDIADARRAERQYLMHEKDPQVLALLARAGSAP